jgi:4-amino-4-deoxy-L-arabinose transferase-like glycosyltransferase
VNAATPGARTVRAGLLAFLVCLFAFRLWYMGRTLLVPDEAYYWSWTRKLAYCYFDQPGMVAWIGRLFTRVFGANVYGVRLAAWTLAALSTAMLYRLAKVLTGDRTWALITAAVANLLPVFSAGALLYIHDSPLLFFWTLACLLVVRIARGGGGRTWLALAAAVLGALAAKFSAVLIGPCIPLFLVLSRDHRKWLARHEPYLAAAIVAVLFAPVIAWNVQHQWVAYFAVDKLSHLQVLDAAGRARSLLDYAGGQFAIFTPLVFAVGLVAMGEGLGRGAVRRDPARLALACLSLPIFAYFLVVAARTKVQANWPMVGFVGGVVLAVDFVRRRWDGPRARAWRVFAAVAIGLAAVSAVVIHVHPLRRIVPFLEGRDLTDQIYGWDGLAARVDAELERAGRGRTVVMARKYQVASELEFYLPGQPRPYCASYTGRGSQYDVDQDFMAIAGKDVIFVDEAERLSKRFRKHFGEVMELAPYVVLREGRPVRMIRLYHLRRFTIDGPFRDYFVDPLGSVVQRMIERRNARRG